MRKVSMSFVYACLILCAGCGSTLRVTRAKTPPPPDDSAKSSTLPGVPFYVKTAGCKHETVWLQPAYMMTLAVTVSYKQSPSPSAQGAAPPKNGTPQNQQHPAESTSKYTFTKSVGFHDFTTPGGPVETFRALLNEADPESTTTIDRVNAIFTAWDNIKPGTYDPFAQSDQDTLASNNVILVANSIAPVTYVDYSTTYYLNSKKPLAGSSQASVKVSDDGTLSEGAAQVESKTLETFLGLVPVNNVLTKIASAELPFSTDQGVVPLVPPAAVEATYVFDLKIDTKLYKRTHSIMMTGPRLKGPGTAANKPKPSNASGGTSGAPDPPSNYIITPPCAEPTSGNLVLEKSYPEYNSSIEEVSGGDQSKPNDNTVKVTGNITLPKSSAGTTGAAKQ